MDLRRRWPLLLPLVFAVACIAAWSFVLFLYYSGVNDGTEAVYLLLLAIPVSLIWHADASLWPLVIGQLVNLSVLSLVARRMVVVRP